MQIDKVNDKRNVIDEMKGLDEDRIRMLRSERSLPFAIAVNNISGGLNLGVIIRTANFLGAKEIFYFGRKHYDKRSTVGTHIYTTVSYVHETSEIEAIAKEYFMVGLENNVEDCYNINDVKCYPKKTCFVLGEEGTGLNKDILNLCDILVEIPGCGTVRSLNVSTAAAIAMYDYVRKSV